MAPCLCRSALDFFSESVRAAWEDQRQLENVCARNGIARHDGGVFRTDQMEAFLAKEVLGDSGYSLLAKDERQVKLSG
ncbi:hypothetical protein CSIRO_0057 [Bradyrhizobiaceae bacterium SG-6C]|nr:hypothetical protein CSIRO_0057 [Bradyrhizobiaceae bacterium SG-6C]